MAAWFEREFGFAEPRAWRDAADAFVVDAAGTTLTAPRLAPGRAWALGAWSTPSLAALRAGLPAAAAGAPELGGATYEGISGDARSLIMDPRNAGAVFLAASQFNALEMVGPDVTPERGVSGYAHDKTQGPACAMACPAALVFRNYLVGGYGGQCGGQHKQVDNLAGVADLVGNSTERYWVMRNGYALPAERGSFARLAERLAADAELREAVRDAVRVGVHWDTQTATEARAPANAEPPHQVCQVFASALPLMYGGTERRTKEWEPLGRAVLDAALEATLLVGATHARARGSRVTVFLTCLGCGAFGNPTAWFIDALERAMSLYATHPLDVKLVTYGHVPAADTPLGALERRLRKQLRRSGARPAGQQAFTGETPEPTSTE